MEARIRSNSALARDAASTSGVAGVVVVVVVVVAAAVGLAAAAAEVAVVVVGAEAGVPESQGMSTRAVFITRNRSLIVIQRDGESQILQKER